MTEGPDGRSDGAKPGRRIAWHIGLGKDSSGRVKDADALWSCLSDYGNLVTEPGTQVDIRFLERTTSLLKHPFLGMVNNVFLVEDVLRCEREGYDAVMVAPAVDPALTEARASVAIPVTGGVEAAMGVAQTLGRRVGLMTIDPALAAVIGDNVARYAAPNRVVSRVPVRVFDFHYSDMDECLAGNAAPLADSVARTAQALIDDGADVVVGAFQWLGASLWRAGYTQWLPDGVPFVDCAACGLKMAELLCRLRETVGIRKSEAPNAPYGSVDTDLLVRAAGLSGEAPAGPAGADFVGSAVGRP
jgi:Asp/Glu/hydantoin racemase